MQEDKND